MTMRCRNIGVLVIDGLYAQFVGGAVFFLARSVGTWWKLEIADGLAVIAVATYFAARLCACHEDAATLPTSPASPIALIQNKDDKSMSVTTITSAQFAELCKAGKKIDLVDVRTPVEFREVHIEFARNVPLDRLDPASLAQARNGSAGEPLYVICQSGGRSQQACEKLRQAGFSNLVNIAGGTLAVLETGVPVIRGKKAISLERQVRIAAGSLVLLGVGCGLFLHPYLFGLAAFVGAGLVFAGITDTCGMGMLLARMPWNQCSDSSCDPR